MKQSCTDEDYAGIFKVYDTNRDGTTTSDEFKAALQSIGECLSAEEAEEMIMEADVSGDGQIELEGNYHFI